MELKYTFDSKDFSFSIPIYTEGSKLYSVLCSGEFITEFVEVEIDKNFLIQVPHIKETFIEGSEAYICFKISNSNIIVGNRDTVENYLLRQIHQFDFLQKNECFLYLDILEFISIEKRIFLDYVAVVNACGENLYSKDYTFTKQWISSKFEDYELKKFNIIDTNAFEFKPDQFSNRKEIREDLKVLIDYKPSFSILFKEKKFNEIIVSYEKSHYRSRDSEKKFYSLALLLVGKTIDGYVAFLDYLRNKNKVTRSDVKYLERFSNSISLTYLDNSDNSKWLDVCLDYEKNRQQTITITVGLDLLRRASSNLTILNGINDYRFNLLKKVIVDLMFVKKIPFDLKLELEKNRVELKIILVMMLDISIQFKNIERSIELLKEINHLFEHNKYDDEEILKIIKLIARNKTAKEVCVLLEVISKSVLIRFNLKNNSELIRLYSKNRFK